jgi:inosose dehydratase
VSTGGAARTTGARIAGAPISWGVCEVPGWGRVLPVDTVLAQMGELGLGATELGPPGFLPDDPDLLRASLQRHGLRLVGGFLAVVLHDADRHGVSLAEAGRTCRQLAAAGGGVLVLAAATGLDGYDERPRLTEDQWRRLITTAAEIRDVAAGFGLHTTLHPHIGTHVEQRAEVERFLADSDLPLCLDTGHLLIGGADPLELTRAHAGRIAHVHLKDVALGVAQRVRSGEISYLQGVQAGLYVPLGEGDVPVADIVATLQGAGYTGWYVLEQDTALLEVSDDAASGAGPDDRPLRDTARSLEHLARMGVTPATG